jgi:hypothetical protein
MELCNDGHDEICFEGRNCPLCKAIEETDAEIKRLKEEIEEWEKSQ